MLDGLLQNLLANKQTVVWSDHVNSLHIFHLYRNPTTFLHAYIYHPLTYSTRQAAGTILQDVADSGVWFAGELLLPHLKL